MKKRKGFTLVETVVTLSILGIAFALTASVVAALMNVQNKASDQFTASKQLKAANDMVNDYVSFVSVKSESTPFTFGSVTSNSVKYTISPYIFELKYSDNTLSISSNYSGSNEYLKKNVSTSLSAIDYIKFEYTSSVSLLVAEMKANDSVLRYTYTLRVQ